MAQVFNFIARMLRATNASMQVFGTRIKRLEMHTLCILTEVSTRAIQLKLSLMARASSGGLLLGLVGHPMNVICTQAHGLMVKCKEKENLSILLMAILLRGTSPITYLFRFTRVKNTSSIHQIPKNNTKISSNRAKSQSFMIKRKKKNKTVPLDAQKQILFRN